MSGKAQRLKALAAYSLLKARARAVLGDLPFTEDKLRVMARASVLVARGYTNSLAVAVRTSLLHASAVTGSFFSLLELNDVAHTLDTHHFDIRKLSRDEIHAVEHALVTFNKFLRDNAVTADTAHAVFGKSRVDSVGSSDVQHAQVGKRLQSAAASQDQHQAAVSKLREDSTHVGDISHWGVTKPAHDEAVTADVLSRAVIWVRNFEDSVDATDGIHTVLLTDDGEVMFLNKRVLDVATTSEQLGFDLHTVKTSTVVSQEQALVSYNKPAADVVGFSDEQVVHTGKCALDEAITADEQSFFVGAYRESTVASSDAAPVTFHKSLADVVGVQDSVRRSTYLTPEDFMEVSEEVEVIRIAANGVPPQVDHQTVSDAYANEHGKHFYETLRSTDDFLGEATTEDDQVVSFRKALPENQFVTERLTASLQKPRSDSIGASDSGLLFLTNYCDISYFAEGFVGQQQTLT